MEDDECWFLRFIIERIFEVSYSFVLALCVLSIWFSLNRLVYKCICVRISDLVESCIDGVFSCVSYLFIWLTFCSILFVYVMRSRWF